MPKPKKPVKHSSVKVKSTSFLKTLYKSIWFFPSLCLIALLLLTVMKISGSSVNLYYKDMFGPNTKDPSLLLGKPRPIRSDEWEWQSSMLVAQSSANYPQTNHNIGDGQSMELITDSPYKSWTTIFRPQNLAFFVMPFAFAFAFKWWLLSFLLVTAAYFFMLLLMPKRRHLAAILSLCLLFSPFVQWWYQTITLAPIFYSLFIIIVFIKMWEAKSRKKLAWALVLSYLLICFALIVYPPFQIPCVLAALAFTFGYVLEKDYLKDKKSLLSGIKYTALALVVVGAVVGLFFVTNKTPITASENSVYPGKRVATSGHFDSQIFLANFLDTQLQITSKAKAYVANQSEVSNFILLSPFLTLPVIFFLIQDKRNKRPLDWPLLLTTLLFCLFMIRLFVSGTDSIFKLILLGTVPNARLLIGIGLVSFMQLGLVIRYMQKRKLDKTTVIIAALATIGTLICTIHIALSTHDRYPGYLPLVAIGIILALVVTAIVGLLLLRKPLPAVLLLFLLSAGSVGAIHPIYRGAGPLYKSEIVNKIHQKSATDPGAKWAMVDNLIYENLPAMAGAPSITGTYAYPQVEFWANNPEFKDQSTTYNRFAHTLVRLEPTEATLDLKQADLFEIAASPCSEYFKRENVKFFVTEKDYTPTYPCLKTVDVISYPNKKFYILEVK